MPHEQPHLDRDPKNRAHAELIKQWEEEAKVFALANKALNNRKQCPMGPAMCRQCGEETCVQIWKEQNKLWKTTEEELKDQEAACHAGTAESFQERTQKLFAKYRKSQELNFSDRPGAHANGSTTKAA